MDTPTILTVAGLFLGCQGLWTLINKVYDNWRSDKKDDPMKKMQKQIDELHAVIMKLTKSLDNNSEVTMAHARDRLNWLCQRYKELGFIPEDDYVAFKLLGEAYINANGNHGFDVQFNHIIENYPRLSTKEIIEKGLYNVSEYDRR